MASLKDAVKIKEAEEPKALREERKLPHSFKSTEDKNKRISAYVNSERYERFTEINKKRGISNNKALNLLISDYVLEQEKKME